MYFKKKSLAPPMFVIEFPHVQLSGACRFVVRRFPCFSYRSLNKKWRSPIPSSVGSDANKYRPLYQFVLFAPREDGYRRLRDFRRRLYPFDCPTMSLGTTRIRAYSPLQLFRILRSCKPAGHVMLGSKIGSNAFRLLATYSVRFQFYLPPG